MSLAAFAAIATSGLRSALPSVDQQSPHHRISFGHRRERLLRDAPARTGLAIRSERPDVDNGQQAEPVKLAVDHHSSRAYPAWNAGSSGIVSGVCSSGSGRTRNSRAVPKIGEIAP
jgi:hypothetical protein